MEGDRIFQGIFGQSRNLLQKHETRRRGVTASSVLDVQLPIELKAPRRQVAFSKTKCHAQRDVLPSNAGELISFSMKV